MKSYKVGIIGHFGFGHDCPDGQTIKTKIVGDAIYEITHGSVCFIDTHGGIKVIIPILIGCFKLLKQCEHIHVLLDQNGIKVVIPLLAFANHFYHKKLHYNVIGGWLPVLLQKKQWLIAYIKKFNYIYVETNTMKRALEELGIYSIVIPNCKNLHIISKNELELLTCAPFPLCTFSRVMQEKGIEDIVNTIKLINSQCNKIIYTLDIYGPVDNSQKEWFKNLTMAFPEYIKYHGIIAYDRSVDVLKNYFALIFPTRFYTEGIPGTIVDAYAAGIPVISSKWESFSDVIDEGITGFGYTFGDLAHLQTILENIAASPDIINQMKINCINKANDFTIERLKNELTQHI